MPSTPLNVTGPVAHHAEGPVWWPGWGGLRYVDMLAGDLLTLRPDGGVDRRHVGDVAAIVRPRAGSGFVVALERDVAVADTDDEPLRQLVRLVDGPAVRLNEGAAAPDGAFYAGGMVTGPGGAASLHRVEPDGTARVVLDGIGCSNGLGFSPDGARAYYADTVTHRVDVLDVVPASEDPRGLVGRRPFVTIDPADGAPDGLAVDAEGGVWVALWGGSAVRRYSPDGTLDAEIRFPASQVTACTFGDDGLDALYVTTSRQDLADDDEPEAGSVFRVDAGVRGLPALPFAG
ncbi:SMP-30/gluconolactonase/LRE family protein [Isoptericola cucumis]|uniref:Gluconolactonase n=1 Tax=Isoptericola cucumis TaxID=1776856 RepID=A0ABQ2B5W2_9MICO|nr:SMP-30/gluconolactonase/LRE family protein [Isoptericola cucumis]GGI06133.1 gluconolactonase [Isoptericola cucumis]